MSLKRLHSKLDTVSYSPFVATMAVSLAIYEIVSVKERRDLENWVRGCSNLVTEYGTVQ